MHVTAAGTTSWSLLKHGPLIRLSSGAEPGLQAYTCSSESPSETHTQSHLGLPLTCWALSTTIDLASAGYLSAKSVCKIQHISSKSLQGIATQQEGGDVLQQVAEPTCAVVDHGHHQLDLLLILLWPNPPVQEPALHGVVLTAGPLACIWLMRQSSLQTGVCFNPALRRTSSDPRGCGRCRPCSARRSGRSAPAQTPVHAWDALILHTPVVLQ